MGEAPAAIVLSFVCSLAGALRNNLHGNARHTTSFCRQPGRVRLGGTRSTSVPAARRDRSTTADREPPDLCAHLRPGYRRVGWREAPLSEIGPDRLRHPVRPDATAASGSQQTPICL